MLVNILYKIIGLKFQAKILEQILSKLSGQNFGNIFEPTFKPKVYPIFLSDVYATFWARFSGKIMGKTIDQIFMPVCGWYLGQISYTKVGGKKQKQIVDQIYFQILVQFFDEF